MTWIISILLTIAGVLVILFGHVPLQGQQEPLGGLMELGDKEVVLIKFAVGGTFLFFAISGFFEACA